MEVTTMTYCEECGKPLPEKRDEYRIEEPGKPMRVVCVHCFHRFHAKELYSRTPK